MGHEYQIQILQGDELLTKDFLKDSNRRCKPDFWIELVPFRYAVWIKTGLKFFGSCPHPPNNIPVPKKVICLMRLWDWLLCVQGCEIIHNLIEQNKASAPSSGA